MDVIGEPWVDNAIDPCGLAIPGSLSKCESRAANAASHFAL